MYRKEKPLLLKGSTSALPNNLSIEVNLEKGIINYATVHKSLVNLISASMDGASVNPRQIPCKEPSAAQGFTMILQVNIIQSMGKRPETYLLKAMGHGYVGRNLWIYAIHGSHCARLWILTRYFAHESMHRVTPAR